MVAFGRSICSLVAALAVSTALLALPVAAHASEPPPEWVAGHNHLSETRFEATVWGELILLSNALGKGREGQIHCRDVLTTSLWNEGGDLTGEGHGAADGVSEGHGATGKGKVVGWGTAVCKAPNLEKALEELFKTKIEEGKIPHPITVYTTAELPLEEETREAEVCKEDASHSELTKCAEHGETERKREISSIRRRTQSFPWDMELVRGTREEEPAVIDKLGVAPEGETCYPKETKTVEGKQVEVAASWTKVPPGCIKITVIAPQIPDEVVLYGTLEPEVIDGEKNGLFPSQLLFDTEAGSLVSGEGSLTEATAEANLTILGEGQRLVRGF